MDGVVGLVAIVSALAGALSTYVAARIDRAHLLRRIDTIAAQRARDRQLLVFYGTTLGDIANKNGLGERFSTGILRVLTFTPAGGTDDRLDDSNANDGA
jgi:hypothetical protein